jgi:VanZ family protein
LLSFDSLAHAFVFMVWSFLLLFGSSRASAQRLNTWSTLLAAVGYGALIELLQGLMRLGRHPDWKDIVCNTFGAILGVLLFYAGSSLLRKF